MEIGFLGALAGGILSCLSPCSVMLLPAFFSYAFTGPRALMVHTGLFAVGVALTLVPMGILSGSVGAFLLNHRAVLMIIAAAVLLTLGVIQISGLTVAFPWQARTATRDVDVRRASAVVLLGAAFGVSSPCTGPILGSVLTIAAAGGNGLYGGALLIAYTVGMCAPLLVLSAAWAVPSSKLRRLLRPRMVSIGRWQNSLHSLIAGSVSVIFAVLIFLFRDNELTGFLSIGAQYEAEMDAAQWASTIPNGLIASLAALCACAVVLIVKRHREPNENEIDRDAPSR